MLAAQAGLAVGVAVAVPQPRVAGARGGAVLPAEGLALVAARGQRGRGARGGAGACGGLGRDRADADHAAVRPAGAVLAEQVLGDQRGGVDHVAAAAALTFDLLLHPARRAIVHHLHHHALAVGPQLQLGAAAEGPRARGVPPGAVHHPAAAGRWLLVGRGIVGAAVAGQCVGPRRGAGRGRVLEHGAPLPLLRVVVPGLILRLVAADQAATAGSEQGRGEQGDRGEQGLAGGRVGRARGLGLSSRWPDKKARTAPSGRSLEPHEIVRFASVCRSGLNLLALGSTVPRLATPASRGCAD